MSHPDARLPRLAQTCTDLPGVGFLVNAKFLARAVLRISLLESLFLGQKPRRDVKCGLGEEEAPVLIRRRAGERSAAAAVGPPVLNSAAAGACGFSPGALRERL